MTNERLEITFTTPETKQRYLGPEDYRSILYLDAGVEIVEQSGITTLYPWAAIHSLRKIRVLDVMSDPTVRERGTARERSIA